MKMLKQLLVLCFLGLPLVVIAQPRYLQEAWQDPAFVERFTGSFLPLTELEPKVSNEEADLFSELSVLLQEDEPMAALNRLREFMGDAPPEEETSAALNYTAGNLLLQQGEYRQAVREYETAIEKFDSFQRAYKNLGLARIQSGQFEGAVEALVKAVELGDSAGDTFGLLGFSYLNLDNPVAALEGYRQASLLNPSNREWRIGKAEALMRTERFEEAIAEFKQLIQEQPEEDAYYTSVANAYLALKESGSAARYLEILRRREAAKPSALALLGDIYINEGLPRLGLEVYNDALSLGGVSTSRVLRVLRVFLQKGAISEAEAFVEAIEESVLDQFDESENREFLNLQANLAMVQGDDSGAAAILEEVLEADPLNGNALLLLGKYYRDQKDLETAIYYFERASGVKDYEREAKLQLARIYVERKEYREAIRLLEQAQGIRYSSNVQDFLEAVRGVYNRAL